MKRVPISLRRLTFMLLIVSALILLACNLFSSLSQGNGPAAGGVENPPTQAPIPDGWVLIKDASGTCQVATPPDWQLEVDFFLAAEEIDPGLFEDMPGQYPPNNLALWGVSEGTPAPEGHHFQIRTSLELTEKVCSVWRIKADVDFTDEEKRLMEQVGGTLQAVQ